MIYMYNGADAHFSTFTDVYNQILSDGKARVSQLPAGDAPRYPAAAELHTLDTDHGIFNAMIAQGWTLVASSGDQGATAGCRRCRGRHVPSL